MAVLAVQHIRRMRGGAQGQLMLGADGHAYVVKFQNNPQHMRVLANELLASRLAVAVGLTAPETDQRRKKLSPAWSAPSAIAATLSGTSLDLMPCTTTLSMTDLVSSGMATSELTARMAAEIIRNNAK